VGETVSLSREPDAGETAYPGSMSGNRKQSQAGLRRRGESRAQWPPEDYSHCACSRLYGFTGAADLYFPQVAQGLNVRIGCYISLPDIEAQLAPNNYTYRHSFYTYDDYTQTGINLTFKLNGRQVTSSRVSR
jgi:hypothetical protein